MPSLTKVLIDEIVERELEVRRLTLEISSLKNIIEQQYVEISRLEAEVTHVSSMSK